MLSVAAVVTGMSLSTPESKPITGILAALAFSSSGMKALESTAARQMAAGFLSSAVWNISTCLSTMASVSGPSKVMSTFRSLAAFCAPSLHGLPELVLEALGNDGDVRLGASWRGGLLGSGGRGGGRGSGRAGANMATTSNRDTTTNSFLDISDSSLQGYVMSAPRGAFQPMK